MRRLRCATAARGAREEEEGVESQARGGACRRGGGGGGGGADGDGGASCRGRLVPRRRGWLAAVLLAGSLISASVVAMVAAAAVDSSGGGDDDRGATGADSGLGDLPLRGLPVGLPPPRGEAEAASPAGVPGGGSGRLNVISLPSVVSHWTPGGIEFSGDATRSVLLLNGTAEDSISWTFFAEPNRTLDDYLLVQRSSVPGVLHATEDTEVSPVSNGDGVSFNATVAFTFDRMPGVTTYTWELRHKADNSLYDSHSVTFLVAGLAIFGAVPGSATPALYSGTDNALEIDYADLLGNTNRTLYAFAQYLNGTNSTAALGPASEEAENDGSGGGVRPGTRFTFADLTTTVSSNPKVLDHNPTRCGAESGTLIDGERIEVEDGCGFAFAADGSIGTVLFGLVFNEYRAGLVEVLFEWDRFTAGTEFAGELYTTSLHVVVGGRPPVVVTRIEEDIPHSPAGGEALTVTMFNSVGRELLGFRVPGASSDFLLRNNSVVVYGAPDYYETAVFETTPGSGKNQTWLLLTAEHGDTAVPGGSGSGPVAGSASEGNGTATTPDGVGGAGAGGPGNVSVAIDRTWPTFRFDYAGSDLRLADGQLPNGDVAGGYNRTLVGNFTEWDPSQGDALLFSNAALDPSWIMEVTPNSLIFTVPPQAEVGKGMTYDLSVMINHVVSNSIDWTYTSGKLDVTIIPAGTSLEVPPGGVNGTASPGSMARYGVPVCGQSTFLAVVHGVRPFELGFRWIMRNGAGVNVLDETTASNGTTLTIDNEFLAALDEVHSLVVEVTTKYGNGQAGLDLVRRDYKLIGVHLVQPVTRTRAYPNVGLRVIAKVQLPSCIEDAPEVLYDWTYDRGDGTSFSVRMSSRNQTLSSQGSISAVRLGRELIVPQVDLLPGVHDVKLFASVKDDPNINGTAHVGVLIEASPLVPVIGSGEGRVQMTDNSSYVLTGSRSHDPDLLTGNQSQFLRYRWDCHIRDRDTNAYDMPCPVEMLPIQAAPEAGSATSPTPASPTPVARLLSMSGRWVPPNDTGVYRMPRSFSVPQAALSAMRSGSHSVFFRYELSVQDSQEPSRVSAAVVQELELLPLEATSVAPFSAVVFRNALGEKVNLRALKSYDELIVAPEADEGVTWEYSLLPPHADLVRMPGALLTRPGYWGPGQENAFVRRPLLGFQSAALLPRTTYQLQVEFFGSSTADNKTAVATEPQRVLYELIVEEAPQVYFPRLARFDGDTEMQWHLSAVSTFATPDVLYFFYLMDADGKKVCVDGCTGAPQASFRVLRPGQYNVLVRLVAASGLSVLDTAEQPEPLVIRQSANQSRSLATHSRALQLRHRAGDDGSYMLDAMYLTETLNSEASSAEVVALSSGVEEEHERAVSLIVQEMVDRVVQISALSVPTTALARNLVTAAATFAAMDIKYLPDENTMYRLVSIATNAIERTPDSESLETVSSRRSTDVSRVVHSDAQLELGGFVTEFYDRLVELSVRRSAGGSARSRLLPRLGDANTLLLDLVELRRQQVTTVATKDKSCGFTHTYRMGSVVDPQLAADLAATLGTSAGSLSTASALTVAVMCNAEQGLYLKGDLGGAFGWCPAVYARGAERKVISIAETFDYVFLSGVRGGNETRSQSSKLVSVDIDELSTGNKLRAAPRVAVGPSQPHMRGEASARLPTRASSFCYSVTLPMSQQLMSRADGCSTVEAFSLSPVKRLNDGIHVAGSDLYGRNYRGLSNAATVGDMSVVASSDRLGLFGARRATCDDPLAGRDDLTGVISVLFTFGILCLIVLLLLVVSACTYIGATTFADDTSEVAAVTNWVERDFYGRTDIRLDLDSQTQPLPPSAETLNFDDGVLGVAPIAVPADTLPEPPERCPSGASDASSVGGGAAAVVIPVGGDGDAAADGGTGLAGVLTVTSADAASNTSAMVAFASDEADADAAASDVGEAVAPGSPPAVAPLAGHDSPPPAALAVPPPAPSLASYLRGRSPADEPVPPPTGNTVSSEGASVDGGASISGATASPHATSSEWGTPPRELHQPVDVTSPPPPPGVRTPVRNGSLTDSPPSTPPPMPPLPTSPRSLQ
ncbi:hypothetical protein MMPV_001043 [Pyropia vietnamensis]